VFVCAAIGYGWMRAGVAFETEFVTTLVTNIGTPCLVFSILTKLAISPEAFLGMAGAAALSILIFGLIGAVVLRLAGWSIPAYLPGLVFANAGNMGLPLSLFAFGEAGLALAITYFTVSAISLYTIGIWITSGQASILGVLRTPLFPAVVLALICLFAGITPPAWIANTTALIGNMVIPLMLIALGVALSRLNVAGLRRSLALALLRLGMGLGVGFALAALLGLEGAARGVLVIQCTMPVAVFNYLFAQRYGQAPEDVAGMVLLSSLISFATLPLLLWLVL
jgi:predicted permease